MSLDLSTAFALFRTRGQVEAQILAALATFNDITVVANYAALPNPTTVGNSFYWCQASQGTAWLPGSLGGTYYPVGIYYSNGVVWQYIESPHQASQSAVNSGTITDQFVSPSTLKNSTQWNSKQDSLGYTAEDAANKSTDGTFASNSDTLYPSQKAAKTYADTKQPLNANLTSLAALGTAADKLAYTTGADTWAETGFSAFARLLLAEASALDARTRLGVGTGDSPTLTGLTLSGATASQLLGTDPSKGLVSLDTATYPSFAEIARVKGLNNPIQPQIDAKVAANTAITGAQKTKITYDAKGLVTSGTDLVAGDIPVLDASKITSGVLDFARIPAGAIQNLVTVADQAARFALTTASVQNGDSVKQTDTAVMYYVVDETNLGNAAGYSIYFAQTDWSLLTSKPANITALAAYNTNGFLVQTAANTFVGRTLLGTANQITVVNGDGVSGNPTLSLPATITGLTSVTSTGFTGALTGNASTATTLQTARTIGGTSFDGSADIVPQTITSANEASDTTCFPLFFTASGTQSLQPKNNSGFTYNSATNTLAATTFIGALSGNATTATTATHIAGGAVNQVVVQTGSGATSFLNYSVSSTADSIVRRDGSQILFGAGLTMDSQYYLNLSSSNPVVNFDTNDYLQYIRTSNRYDFNVGGAAGASISSTGVLTSKLYTATNTNNAQLWSDYTAEKVRITIGANNDNVEITSRRITGGTFGSLIFDFPTDAGGTVGGMAIQGQGLQVGSPTGGNKGAGTINVASDIYKNNTAYTNPDYVLEMWATGAIKKFASNPGAKNYKLLSIEKAEKVMRKTLRLPGMSDKPMGSFGRQDFLLEKLEEAFIYITQLHKRLDACEAAIKSK